MSAFRPLPDGSTYVVTGMKRSAITGRFIPTTPERTPDENPEHGQIETRDWHPDEQPDDNGRTLDFTPDEADAIQLYIDQIKDLLGLAQWDAFLSLAASDETTNASVHPRLRSTCRAHLGQRRLVVLPA